MLAISPNIFPANIAGMDRSTRSQQINGLSSKTGCFEFKSSKNLVDVAPNTKTYINGVP